MICGLFGLWVVGSASGFSAGFSFDDPSSNVGKDFAFSIPFLMIFLG